MSKPTVEHLRCLTTCSVAEAAAFLDMSTATGYRALADGTLPVIVVGKRQRVPVPRLLALVGLPYEAEHQAAPP